MPPKKNTSTNTTEKKPMTKAEILSHLSEKTGLPKKQVSEVVDELVNLAYQEAKVGFNLPGLGKLVVQRQEERKGRNPATGEQITIPAKDVLKFRISKTAKDAITPPKKK